MNKDSNQSIKCSVTQCKNNATDGFCALHAISVGTHEANPTQPQCTDCMSFILK